MIFIIKSNRQDVTNFVLFDLDDFKWRIAIEKEKGTLNHKTVSTCLMMSTQSHEVSNSEVKNFIESLPFKKHIIDVSYNSEFLTTNIGGSTAIQFDIELIPESIIDPKKPVGKVVINHDDVLEYMQQSTTAPYEPKQIGLNYKGVFMNRTKLHFQQDKDKGMER